MMSQREAALITEGEEETFSEDLNKLIKPVSHPVTPRCLNLDHSHQYNTGT